MASAVREVQYPSYMLDTDDHQSWDSWIDDFADDTNDGELSDFPSDEYDDHNTFYRISISAKEPKTILDRYRNEFVGRKWFPKKFFKRIYLRNFLTKAKNFLAELEELDLRDVPRKKSMQNKIIKARQALRRAEKYYDKHEFKALKNIFEAVDLCKSVVEDLYYLDQRGRLES